jgi:hypothetical protein
LKPKTIKLVGGPEVSHTPNLPQVVNFESRLNRPDLTFAMKYNWHRVFSVFSLEKLRQLSQARVSRKLEVG